MVSSHQARIVALEHFVNHMVCRNIFLAKALVLCSDSPNLMASVVSVVTPGW